jgi:hypothetical protein
MISKKGQYLGSYPLEKQNQTTTTHSPRLQDSGWLVNRLIHHQSQIALSSIQSSTDRALRNIGKPWPNRNSQTAIIYPNLLAPTEEKGAAQVSPCTITAVVTGVGATAAAPKVCG